LVGAIERCELFQWETRDFDEKIVEVIVVVSVVKGIEIGESFEAAKEGC
jgi:chorismate synthase